MEINSSSFITRFNDWDEQHLTLEQIATQLQDEGLISDHVSEIVRLYKKRKLDERTRKGFILMGIGSFLGFISCVFTVYEVMPFMQNFILYGLTSIGITLALWGGYYVFE